MLVAEYNAAGTMLRRHVHGGDPGDDPIAWYEGATMTQANERLLRADWQGSVVSVSTDRTATAMLAINRYDEYGIPQAGNAGRFQYTGQAWFPELGLYYYKARWYSPRLGRFMQTDPIGYDDGLNIYAYVANDPVNGVDPTGMCETQTGSRICRSEGTTLVKSESIPIRDENGKSNSALVRETVGNFSKEAIGRTEESEFTSEHGVTVSMDEKQKTFVVSLFQGPKKSFFGGGSLNIVPTHRKLLYSVHTHTGIGVREGSGGPVTTISNWMRGRSTVASGPSSTGGANDLTAAGNWRASNNRNARFGVYYQVLDPGGNLHWRYEGY